MISFRMQIGFLLYIGLIMLSYGYNKFSRTTILLAQLSMLLQSTSVSWKNYVKEKLEKLIIAFRKTIETGNARFLSSTKLNRMPSPHEVNQRKGSDFFMLWSRYIIMHKLALMIKIYQDNYRAHPEEALFSMKILTDKDNAEMKNPANVAYYCEKSFSLFQ